MDLRDAIAVAVLPSLLDNPECFVEVRSADKAGVAARAAYRIADAMLDARGPRKAPRDRCMYGTEGCTVHHPSDGSHFVRDDGALQGCPCNGRGTAQVATDGENRPGVGVNAEEANAAVWREPHCSTHVSCVQGCAACHRGALAELAATRWMRNCGVVCTWGTCKLDPGHNGEHETGTPLEVETAIQSVVSFVRGRFGPVVAEAIMEWFDRGEVRP